MVDPDRQTGSGYSITSAPLYYDGRVYVGGSGGEYGVRGRLTALDAKTGKIPLALLHHPEPEGNRRRHLARQRLLQTRRREPLEHADRRSED